MPKAKGDFDQGKYVVDYMKENIKQVRVSLNRTKDEDNEIIHWLESQPEGASGYIKRLIRNDMNNGGTKN